MLYFFVAQVGRSDICLFFVGPVYVEFQRKKNYRERQENLVVTTWKGGKIILHSLKLT